MSNTRVGTAEKGWKGPKVKDRRNILKSRGARSVSRGARPVSRGARPVSRGARPVSRGARPVSRGARPVSRGARPVSRGARPVIWSETHRIEPIGFHLCTRIRAKEKKKYVQEIPSRWKEDKETLSKSQTL